MSADIERFLDRFFGEGNEISREQARRTPELAQLVEGVRLDLSTPAILPRRLSEQSVEWFVLCGDDAGLRRAQTEVVAFIGPTYGRWDGIRADLRPSDPVEAAVIDVAGGRAIRFHTHGDTEFKECWTAIRLMRAVWAQRPEQQAEQVRTGATLVREFELSTAAGDTETAAETLDELRRRGLLGADNLRFLEVRLLASEGRWSEISAASDLRDLARIRRPWLVTEDILTALYRSHVKAHETAADVDAAITAVNGVVADYPELFSSRGPLRSPDVVKLFALRIGALGTPEPGRILALRDGAELPPDDSDWVRAIAESIAPPATAPLNTARDLLNQGDLDGAFALAARDRGDAKSAEVLIECAFELQTLEAASAALEALDALTNAERERFLDRRLIFVAVEYLRSLAEPSQVGEPAAPESWKAWFERLLNDPGWRAAQAVAVCGELEYSAKDIMDGDAGRTLASLIVQAADSDRRQVLRDALPHIVGWLERMAFELGPVKPVHTSILTVLALDSSWGDAALEVAYNSTEAVLAAGVDEGEYAELLEQLGLLWERMAARRHVAWLADLFELLELFPGPRDPLVGFAAATLAQVQGVLGRVSRTILDALRVSLITIGASELAQSLPVPEAPQETVQAAPLEGKLVGIYTLTPQVGIRAKQAIERHFPGVKVEIDSSHVSTPSLEQLARSADYLIVSIRSAKHAATDAIDRCRSRHLPTIVPGGRGSSRMVEALIAAVP